MKAEFMLCELRMKRKSIYILPLFLDIIIIVKGKSITRQVFSIKVDNNIIYLSIPHLSTPLSV